jgi:hypothetical protein
MCRVIALMLSIFFVCLFALLEHSRSVSLCSLSHLQIATLEDKQTALREETAILHASVAALQQANTDLAHASEQSVAAKTAEINSLNQTIAKLNDDIQKGQEEITALKAQLEYA